MVMKYICPVETECSKIHDNDFFVHRASRVSLKHLSERQIADVQILKLTAEA